jgi:GAF domain-containing protein
MMLIHVLGLWDEAYRFARLAFELANRLGPPTDRARVYIAVSAPFSWVRPLREARVILEDAIDSARACGDVTYECYLHAILAAHLIIEGRSLSDIDHVVDEGMHCTQKVKFGALDLYLTGPRRLALQLQGRTTHFSTFNDKTFDEGTYEAALETVRAAFPMGVGNYYVWKLMARYLSNDYDEALVAAERANQVLWSMPAFVHVPEYHFYTALARAALCARATPAEREAHLAALRTERERFRVWAERCPENFLHKHALVAAEVARVEEEHVEAERLYEQGIASAHDQGFVSHEALGLELAGRYYSDRGLVQFGETFLRSARACWARWGADGKVAQLEQLYPRIVAPSVTARVATLAANPEQLDLLSVMKASQSIAEEIDLDVLIRHLMRVVLEQSVAQRGYLLLTRNGAPVIAAEARSTEQGIDVTVFSTAPADPMLVSDSLVNYVWRTREQIILSDASDATKRQRVMSDDYVARFRPKSVLCRPIVRKAQVVGLLYLENDLVTHAFTPGRVAALEVLASQAAISLEIASSLQEERRARAALVASESRFRRLYESNMIGILFADLSGRITEANDYVLSLLQYTRAELESGAIWWTSITPA